MMNEKMKPGWCRCNWEYYWRCQHYAMLNPDGPDPLPCCNDYLLKCDHKEEAKP